MCPSLAFKGETPLLSFLLLVTKRQNFFGFDVDSGDIIAVLQAFGVFFFSF